MMVVGVFHFTQEIEKTVPNSHGTTIPAVAHYAVLGPAGRPTPVGASDSRGAALPWGYEDPLQFHSSSQFDSELARGDNVFGCRLKVRRCTTGQIGRRLWSLVFSTGVASRWPTHGNPLEPAKTRQNPPKNPEQTSHRRNRHGSSSDLSAARAFGKLPAKKNGIAKPSDASFRRTKSANMS